MEVGITHHTRIFHVQAAYTCGVFNSFPTFRPVDLKLARQLTEEKPTGAYLSIGLETSV